MDNTEKKVTPGKIALSVALVIVLAATLIAIVVTGINSSQTDVTANNAVEATEAAKATVPTDGNPENETAKGSYTASNWAVRAAADKVVATMGEYTLTNGQLQVYYWMEVQNFLSSYGTYAMYFGLDVSQGLDTQTCLLSENGETWQQFFLAGALNTWRNHQALAAEAEKAGYQMEADMQAELDSIPENMEKNAQMYGMADAEELLAYNVGKGADVEDYQHFMNLYYYGTLYFNEQVNAFDPTDEEVEAYFTENEASYQESGLTRDAKYVDVRHVLIMPEGADSSNIRTETFDEAAWEASRIKAEELMAQWEQGDKSEDSFAQLAKDHSQDGSASNGGLYTDVTEGQMVTAFNDWCFDASRQAGDYAIVETEFGYHLMFFVDSRPMWVEHAESDLKNTWASELLDAAIANYPIEADYAKMRIAYVDIDGKSTESLGLSGIAQEMTDEENLPVLLIAGVSLVLMMGAVIVFKKKEH